ANSLLNVEAGVKAVATLPFVTSSISATPEREDDNPTDSVTRADLRVIGPAERFIVPPPVINKAVITAATTSIPFATVPETNVAGPSHLPGKELSLGSREVDSEHLHEICDMDYEQLFIEFNVGTARQVCLNAEVR
ncbi:hypothetical protein Tco_1196215, partial [Tanacetum coccineum]